MDLDTLITTLKRQRDEALLEVARSRSELLDRIATLEASQARPMPKMPMEAPNADG